MRNVGAAASLWVKMRSSQFVLIVTSMFETQPFDPAASLTLLPPSISSLQFPVTKTSPGSLIDRSPPRANWKMRE